MYIRPKVRNGYPYFQVVLGEGDKKKLAGYTWGSNKSKMLKIIADMPTTITLPRVIFLTENTSIKAWDGQENRRCDKGTVMIEGSYQDGVVHPDHPRYVRACVDAAESYYRHVVKSTRPIPDGMRPTTRKWREHLKHEKANAKWLQMLALQRLTDDYRSVR